MTLGIHQINAISLSFIFMHLWSPICARQSAGLSGTLYKQNRRRCNCYMTSLTSYPNTPTSSSQDLLPGGGPRRTQEDPPPASRTRVLTPHPPPDIPNDIRTFFSQGRLQSFVLTHPSGGSRQLPHDRRVCKTCWRVKQQGMEPG